MSCYTAEELYALCRVIQLKNYMTYVVLYSWTYNIIILIASYMYIYKYFNCKRIENMLIYLLLSSFIKYNILQTTSRILKSRFSRYNEFIALNLPES
jgi:hypothetical protein